MRTNKYFSLFSTICLLAIAMSCNRETVNPVPEEEDLSWVPVTMSLNVAAIESGTPETKTTMEPDEGVSSDDQIANFVILQFNGVDGNAVLTGGQRYIDHFPLVGDEEITLVASQTPNTVIILANTFGRISITSGTTLASFMEQDYSTISDLSGVFTTSGGNDYLRMSGSLYLASISAGTSVNVTLKRNVAKVVLRITNNTAGNTGDDLVSFSKIQLTDINAKYYYFTHVDPDITSVSPSVAFTDPYEELRPRRFSTDYLDFPVEKNPGGASAGTAQEYVFYVPANLRGTTSNTQQFNKASGAPKGATKLSVHAAYGASSSPIIYSYYLGGNLTNDFNLRPNYKYTYQISVNSKGDAYYDTRIEDLGEVVFSTDANCYMLQPPEVSGYSRVYSFPVRRAAVFWNPEGQNLGVYGASDYGDYTSYVMDGTTAWTAEVLWSSFDMTDYLATDPSDPRYPNRFLQVASGRGFDPNNPGHSQPFIKVKVQAGMKGNVLVGLRHEGGQIVWSWHLWITDYNPDRHVELAEHKYNYGVSHGNVQRLVGNYWNTAPSQNTIGYADGVMMDRWLGSFSPENIGNYDHQGLLYSYGRKDPFCPYPGNFYLGGTIPANAYGANSDLTRPKRYGNTGTVDNWNTRFTVSNPTVNIYNSGQWTAVDDDLNGLVWNDSKFWEHTGNQEILELKKSVYDPCPPGWKVMMSYAYPRSNPYAYANAGNIGDESYYKVFENNKGMVFYPETYGQREATGGITFASQSFRFTDNFYGGGNGYNILQGCHIYSDPYLCGNSSTGAVRVYCFVFHQNDAGNVGAGDWGFPASSKVLRCVRE